MLPSSIELPVLPPSYIRRASRAFNTRQEQYSAEKKEKVLPHLMSVVTFHFRLGALGIAVRELTGDMQLTKTEIMQTQVS